MESVAVIGVATPSSGLAETHEYILVADAEDWVSYWQMAKESSLFSGGLAMPGVEPGEAPVT